MADEKNRLEIKDFFKDGKLLIKPRENNEDKKIVPNSLD